MLLWPLSVYVSALTIAWIVVQKWTSYSLEKMMPCVLHPARLSEDSLEAQGERKRSDRCWELNCSWVGRRIAVGRAMHLQEFDEPKPLARALVSSGRHIRCRQRRP